MSLGKGYLSTVKGKKVIFKVVNSSPDLKVQFVEGYADYKVKIANNRAFAKETIRIQVVNYGADVKLRKVTAFADFEAYIE